MTPYNSHDNNISFPRSEFETIKKQQKSRIKPGHLFVLCPLFYDNNRGTPTMLPQFLVTLKKPFAPPTPILGRLPVKEREYKLVFLLQIIRFFFLIKTNVLTRLQ